MSHDWAIIFRGHAGKTDSEIAEAIGCHRRTVWAHRQRLAIPARRTPKSADANIWCRIPKATRSAVETLAESEGVTMSAWVLASIVERMERVEQRMAYLAVSRRKP
jgi:predicted transcriptional regulator